MPCTSLTWWRNVDVTEIMPFSVHVTVTNHHATERDAIFYPSRDVATQFARFKSGGLQHLGYPSREGLPFANRWCEGVERTSAEGVEGWRLLDHIIITTAIAQWRSRLNARFRVNGGHFQHKFWASDFLLCFACFIDTSSPKCDRYKHVQSANIVWNVLLLCLRLSHGIVATQRMCGRKFLYVSDFGILLWSCARKITKIRQYL